MNLRALFELCRISNLPTVWSNVVLGVFAGRYAYHQSDATGRSSDALTLFLATATVGIAMSLMYSGGMILNDVLDRCVDARERPGRPIPSGRIGVRAASRLVMLCFALGLMGMTVTDVLQRPDLLVHGAATLYTAVLLGLIFAYNNWHQASAITVLLMGLCRAAVVLSAAAVLGPTWLDPGGAWQPWVYGPALTLVLYTIAISIVARREVEHERAAQPRRFGILPRLTGGPKTIMNMIAGMPLLDAVWLLVMGLWPASLFCVACAGLTKLGHRKVAGS